MPVLSIIACEMLQDELVHVLSKDSELKQLIVVENRNISGFLRKLKSKNCIPKTIFLDRVPMFIKDESSPDLEVPIKFLSLFPFFKRMFEKRKIRERKKVDIVVNILSIGLHADLGILKAEVYKNISEMAPFSDNILIFYGNCGHTLGKLEEDFAELGCQLSFLKDKDGEIIEDCISLALGGNESYARSMLEFRSMGTIYLTPMWASSWKRLENEVEGKDSDNKYLKNPLYCMTAKIDTGLANNLEFDENVKKFARKYNMKITDLKGNVEIAEQSYFAARSAVTGR